jgi:hypothetical protein
MITRKKPPAKEWQQWVHVDPPESNAAFEVFCAFCRTPSHVTVKDFHKTMKEKGYDYALSTFHQWKSRYNWDDRKSARLQHINEQRDNARVLQLNRTANEMEKFRSEVFTEYFSLSKDMLKTAKEIFKLELTSTKFNLRDAIKLAEAADDMLQKALDHNEIHTQKESNVFIDDEYKTKESMLASINYMKAKLTPDHRTRDGVSLNYEDFPALYDIHNEVTEDLVLIMATQQGKTVELISDFFALAHTGMNSIFIEPKSSIRDRVVHDRIDNHLTNGGLYEHLRGQTNNVKYKKFKSGSSALFVHAQNQTELVEFMANRLYIDEANLCNPEVLGYADDRLEASLLKSHYVTTTATIKNAYGEKRYENSNKNVRMAKCPHCGNYAPFKFKGTFVYYDFDDSGNINNFRVLDPEFNGYNEPRAYCSNCDKFFNRFSAHAEWVPEKTKDYSWIGYRLSALWSRRTQISQIVSEFEKSFGNQSLLKQFFNSRLAIPFTSSGSAITVELLKRCAWDSKWDRLPRLFSRNKGEKLLNHNDFKITAGIDQRDGDRRLDWRISLYDNKKETRRMLSVGYGTMEDLLLALDVFSVEVFAIDGMPALTTARNVLDKAEATGYIVMNSGRLKTASLKVDQSEPKYPTVSFAKHYWWDVSYQQVVNQYNIVPTNFENLLDGIYCKHMECDVSGYETVSGSDDKRVVWKMSGEHNDQRSADVHDILATNFKKRERHYVVRR